MDALGLGGIDDTRSAEDVAHANFSKEVDLGDKVIIGVRDPEFELVCRFVDLRDSVHDISRFKMVARYCGSDYWRCFPSGTRTIRGASFRVRQWRP
jgi:hypothetical protein